MTLSEMFTKEELEEGLAPGTLNGFPNLITAFSFVIALRAAGVEPRCYRLAMIDLRMLGFPYSTELLPWAALMWWCVHRQRQHPSLFPGADPAEEILFDMARLFYQRCWGRRRKKEEAAAMAAARARCGYPDERNPRNVVRLWEHFYDEIDVD